jgi:hypothetical protein
MTFAPVCVTAPSFGDRSISHGASNLQRGIIDDTLFDHCFLSLNRHSSRAVRVNSGCSASSSCTDSGHDARGRTGTSTEPGRDRTNRATSRRTRGRRDCARARGCCNAASSVPGANAAGRDRNARCSVASRTTTSPTATCG